MAWYKKAPEDKLKTWPQWPSKWTEEYLTEICNEFLEWTKNWLPYKDKDGKNKVETIIFKKWLAKYKNFSRKAFVEAVSNYEQENNTEKFSAIIMEIEEIIEDRIFKAGFMKKADWGMAKLYLTAHCWRTSDRSDNRNTNTTSMDPEDRQIINNLISNNL